MLNTLVFFTYLDVRARLSISHLRLSSDRRTILIWRGPHLAMIPSPGDVSVRMNIIFTPMNHLKQLSQYECIVSRTEIPYRKCRSRVPSSEIRKWVVNVWELRELKPVPLQKAAQTCIVALVNPKVSLCSARRGEPRRKEVHIKPKVTLQFLSLDILIPVSIWLKKNYLNYFPRLAQTEFRKDDLCKLFHYRVICVFIKTKQFLSRLRIWTHNFKGRRLSITSPENNLVFLLPIYDWQ